MSQMRKQRGIRLLPWILAVFLLLGPLLPRNVQAAEVLEGWPAPPEIASETGVVMDLSTGEILYNKDMDKQMYPASLTKVMTALLALEHASLDEQVTFTELGVRDVYPGSSNAGMQVGETITLEQCLYLLMLKSANEVATQIGEYVGGSEEGFADLMNQRAADLGCTNTQFRNASGLHDPEHHTSAHDLALIGQAAFRYDAFRKIIATQQYDLPATNMNPSPRHYQNHHVMILDGNQFFYQYCLGGKTGNTDEAHNTLLTYAEKDGLQLIAVVMKSDGLAEWTDTRALFDYVYDNAELLEPEETPEPTKEPEEEPEEEEPEADPGDTLSGPEQTGNTSGIGGALKVIAGVLGVLILLGILLILIRIRQIRRRRRRRRKRRNKRY